MLSPPAPRSRAALGCAPVTLPSARPSKSQELPRSRSTAPVAVYEKLEATTSSASCIGQIAAQKRPRTWFACDVLRPREALACFCTSSDSLPWGQAYQNPFSLCCLFRNSGAGGRGASQSRECSLRRLARYVFARVRSNVSFSSASAGDDPYSPQSMSLSQSSLRTLPVSPCP